MHFNPKQWPFIEWLHLSSFPQLWTCQRVWPEDPRGWSSSHAFFLSSPARYLDYSIITCICLVCLRLLFLTALYSSNKLLLFQLSPLARLFVEKTSFTIKQRALLGDSKMNFVQGNHLWWNWPGSALGVLFPSCVFSTLVCPLLGNFSKRAISPGGDI